MTTETTTSKSDTPVIENIEQASSNFYWTFETVNGVFNFQTTVRGVLSPEQMQAHIKSLMEMNAHIVSLGGQAKGTGKYDNPNAAVLPQPTPVDAIITETMKADPMWNPPEANQPSTPSGATEPTQDNVFDTSLLVVSINNGKKYFKIKGGNWSKYGVTVWDEVLATAGIPAARLEGKEYNLTGYKATIVRKPDGKPEKVVRLEKVA
jgi:hypothetical protein